MIALLIGFVLVLKWGGAPKQRPGRASSVESTTAWHSGRSSDGPGGL
jgi:hypothetical protein